ncbi:Trk family potassium uptake protein [Limosilactobacillus reuteri]|uniref:TrkH family potassium uptake protein n=1 Tax=Limosilactobacillus reuteri TaxID=1598 RepID=UPI001E41EE9B|nr:potassium transporter TrkG [Limosilactobacillus reuteri]MCC4470731.1 Trk family potassium uptake protein [Limosilactobacillus reuteri]
MIEINKHKYTFPKILTFGFLIVIFMGTILLSLPFATRPGETTNFMTAFFTSTSATCVTGLTLVSTAHHWTLFGQIVIAILMEVGGLGFMTFAVMMSLLIRQRMRMSTRLLTQEALNLDHLSQLNVVYLIIRLSLLIQLAGGIFLFFDFYPCYGLGKGIWFSIFHSISAFCNAGFDLFDNSMANYANDPYMLCVLAVLIVAGSLGFLVWKDILNYPKYHQLSLHTQLALRTGAVLFVVSVVVYFITEKNLAQLSDKLSFSNRILNTIFMAITPRTAGLITFPYTDLSAAGLAFTVILMFIGGTPGSTAGGVKTTTIGLLTIQSFATLRGQRDTTFAHRRFTQENIYRALTLLFVALFILLVSILVLVETQDLPKHDSLAYVTFEAVAAFGTTGISLGITTHLNLLGQFIIMFLMFVGRVGIYTVMFSILNASTAAKNYRYPEESVLIG